METRTRRRLAVSGPSAVALSLLLATEAFAAAWSEPVRVSDSNSWISDICANGDRAFIAYTDFADVWVARSKDAGASWQRRYFHSGDSFLPYLACRGTAVDVAWTENYTARYTRSTNNGTTFAVSMRLSPKSHEVRNVDVARGPGSLVAVVWFETDFDDFPDFPAHVWIRVSRNGGRTFGPSQKVAGGGNPVVAISDDAIHVAYIPDEADRTGILVTRSIDFGKTWSEPVTITRKHWGRVTPSLAVEGDTVYVAYAEESGTGHWAAYRRSTDGGETWSAPVNLTKPTGKPAEEVRISADNGVVRAVFDRCRDYFCNRDRRVVYRESHDGLTWSEPELVSPEDAMIPTNGGATFSGKALVAYTTYIPDPEGEFRGYVRAGSD